ncbi:MAG: hypothetical protein KDB94_11800 [Acidobacteria bacterium]|nr:hypothetical protein [Acidobacteriota bacterium]MCB9378169.1 hypothetical protein [Holophagales bacterium]
MTLARTASRSLFGGTLLLLLATACASDGAVVERSAETLPARDVPALFERGTGVPGVRAAAGSCWNPMVDPRDGTTLRLVRSANGAGDYEPPAGRYGVGSDQLLRLDCASGKTIGIVAR